MKVTKKEFISLYPKMRLAGVIDRELPEVLAMIDNAPIATIENTKETSRYDIDNYHDIKTVTIYKHSNKHNTFYIVYTVLDNSKNSDVSWNETTYHCTIYVIL
jgi:hypothetical protein